jgi:hypothetical protein
MRLVYTAAIGLFVASLGFGQIYNPTQGGSSVITGDVAKGANTTSSTVNSVGGQSASNVAITVNSAFNVKLSPYGAKGDGSTDDTTAIQSAVTAVCASGGNLILPPGTYPISSTILTPKQCNGILFRGSGGYSAKGSILKWIGASGGTVLNVYASSWDSFKDFTIDGNHLAGKGLWVQASNTSPADGSAQKNVFENLMIINCTGTPGQGLAVYGLNNDDVSQNDFRDLDLASNTTNLYQDGTQTLLNVYHNITSYNATSYGFYFNAGDVTMYDNTFLVDTSAGAGTLAQLAHVYISANALWARLTNNYYENLSGVNPSIFSTYSFPSGSAPNRALPTYIKGDRVQWSPVGGKILDYEQQGPVSLQDLTVQDNSGSNSPGTLYFNNSVVGTTQVNVQGGNYSTPSFALSLGANVSLRVNNAQISVRDDLIEGNDASYTSGSATLTLSGSHSFTAAMVGQACYVQGFASATAQQQAITAFTDANDVTLAASATATGTGKYYRCGRNVNVGASTLATSTPTTVDASTAVVDGGKPRVWLRRFASDFSTQNYAFWADSTGAKISSYSADNPTSATPSDFVNFNITSGIAASTTFPVPVAVGTTPSINQIFTAQFADNLGGAGITLKNNFGNVIIGNNTSTASSFSPRIQGNSKSSVQPGLELFGNGAAGDDSGTAPLVIERGMINGGAVTTRPIWQIQNFGTVLASMSAAGTFGVGTSNQFSVTANGSAKTAALQTTVRTVSAATDTATVDDNAVNCVATSNAVTETLPASPTTGQWFHFKKVDSSANTCTLAGNGKTIDGASTYVLSTQYKFVSLQYNSAQWFIFGSN